jgi:hypothetical protein
MFRQQLVIIALLGSATLGQAGTEEYFESRVHDFGATPRGPQLVHYFRFTNNGKETLSISSVRVSCGCVTASAAATQVKLGESSYIAASMDSRRFTGHKAVTVYVQFSSPRFEEVALQVQANGRDDFSMYPDTMVFGPIRRGTTPKASVQVTLVGDLNWEIKGITADSNFVKPSAKQIKRNGNEVTYEIMASLRPDLPVGKWYTDVWLETSNPNLAKVRVPLTVEVNTAITATPAALELGDIKMGESVEQNVLVKADKPFKIKGIRGADAQVSVGDLAEDAKAVHVVKITVKPVMPGEVRRAISIVTDDGDETAVTIPVRAVAVKE